MSILTCRDQLDDTLDALVTERDKSKMFKAERDTLRVKFDNSTRRIRQLDEKLAESNKRLKEAVLNNGKRFPVVVSDSLPNILSKCLWK